MYLEYGSAGLYFYNSSYSRQKTLPGHHLFALNQPCLLLSASNTKHVASAREFALDICTRPFSVWLLRQQSPIWKGCAVVLGCGNMVPKEISRSSLFLVATKNVFPSIALHNSRREASHGAFIVREVVV
jgi:hypothetical protein